MRPQAFDQLRCSRIRQTPVMLLDEPTSLRWLANDFGNSVKWSRPPPSLLRAIEILESIDLTQATPDESIDVRYRLARALKQLAVFELDVLWKFSQAGDHVKQAAELMRQLHAEEPDEHRDRSHVGPGAPPIRRRRSPRVPLSMRRGPRTPRGLSVAAALDQRHPDVPHVRQELAELHQSAGCLHGPLESANLTPAGLEHQDASLSRLAATWRLKFPQQVDRQLALARYEASLADAYRYRGRADDARRDHRKRSRDAARRRGRRGRQFRLPLLPRQSAASTGGSQLARRANLQNRSTGLSQARVTIDKLEQLAPDVGEVALMAATYRLNRSMTLIDLQRLSDAIAEFNQFNIAIERCSELAEAPWMKASVASMKALAAYRPARRRQRHPQRRRSAGTRRRRQVSSSAPSKRKSFLPSPANLPTASSRPKPSPTQPPKPPPTSNSTWTTNRDSIESLSLEVRSTNSNWRGAKDTSAARARAASRPPLRFRPSLPTTFAQDEQFEALRNRDDFAKLMQRIEEEDPPPAESAPAA